MVKIKKEIFLLLWVTFFCLADRSDKFVSFLTTTRKFRYHCVHIFHVIFLEKAIWRSLFSLTNIFNTFLASIPLNSVKKTSQTNCKHKSLKIFIPEYSLWSNKRFVEIANKNKRICLTVD